MRCTAHCTGGEPIRNRQHQTDESRAYYSSNCEKCHTHCILTVIGDLEKHGTSRSTIRRQVRKPTVACNRANLRSPSFFWRPLRWDICCQGSAPISWGQPCWAHPR